jgi:hypothetical protein
MPEEYTNADAVGLFLTGAENDGGEQTDPAASLGNYRSSTRIEQIGFQILSCTPGVTIERVSGANGAGLGSIQICGENELQYTAPAGQPGDSVTILNGQTKLLESAGERTKFVVVKRHTSAAMTGSFTLQFMPVYNDVIGSGNVEDAERQAGEVKLRCIALKVCHASQGVLGLKIWVNTLGQQQVSDLGQLPASGTGILESAGSFAGWPVSGFCRITTAGGTLREIVYYSSKTGTELIVPEAGRGLLGTTASAGAADDKLDAVSGIKIAKELPTGGAFNLADDENDTEAVEGLFWSTGITEATGIDCGNLAAGEMVGLWLWLAVVAGASASPKLINTIRWRFDAE